MSDEREELQDLLSTPGWGRFCAHVKRQLGEPMFDLMGRIVQNARNREDAAKSIIELSIHRTMTLQQLAWPAERLKQLDRIDAEANPKPRGAQLRALPNRGKSHAGQ